MKSHFLRRSLLAVVVVTASYAVPAFADESCNVRYHTKAIRAPGYIQANAINERGHVVGQFDTPAGGSDAFIWTRAHGLKDLGTLAAVSSASDINDRDAVVGTNRAGSPTFANSAFLWSRLHGMRDIGRHLESSRAEAINNWGQVAGAGRAPSAEEEHAYLWSPGKPLRDLGTLPGGSRSSASGINERGHVVGDSLTASNTAVHAFLWTRERKMEDLGTLGGSYSVAHDINDRDEVVGGGIDDQFNSYAFLWTRQHGMRDLGNLGGTCDGDTYAAAARAVNIRGRVVGFSSPPDSPDCFHAIVWSRRCGMQDLNDLIDPGSGISVLFEANDINARGQIVANGTDINGVTRAYLLTPEIDEMISALP